MDWLDLSGARLLIRPLPLAGESVRGYFLRLSEANGLAPVVDLLAELLGNRSPWTAGSRQIRQVADRLGLDPSAVDRLGCSGVAGDRVRCSFAGHSISLLHVRKRQSAICPACVASLPAVRIDWELRHQAVCSDHGCWLIDMCPQCEEPLRWRRPGVGVCRCGFDLTRTQLSPAPRVVVELARVLSERVRGNLRPAMDASVGFPGELRAITLSQLLSVFHYFMRRRVRAVAVPLTQLPNATRALSEQAGRMQAVSEALCQWPAGWDRLITRLGGLDVGDSRKLVTAAEILAPFATLQCQIRSSVAEYPAFLRRQFRSCVEKRRVKLGRRRLYVVGPELQLLGRDLHRRRSSELHTPGFSSWEVRPTDRVSPAAVRELVGATPHQMRALRGAKILPRSSGWMDIGSLSQSLGRLLPLSDAHRYSDRRPYLPLAFLSEVEGDGLERLLNDARLGAARLTWRSHQTPPGLGNLCILEELAVQYGY